jgi:hypothetical protein
MKICNKCKDQKELSMFYKDSCKKDKLSGECKDCAKKYSREYRLKNLNYFKDYGLNYRKNNNNNAEYFKSYSKEYYQKVLKEKRKILKKENSLYKLKLTLQSKTSLAFKKNKFNKNSKYEKIFGETYFNIKQYLENKFKEGMNWDNHSLKGWHIDHIIPLSFAKSEEELLKLCHYTNLQPLWSYENWSKGFKTD